MKRSRARRRALILLIVLGVSLVSIFVASTRITELNLATAETRLRVTAGPLTFTTSPRSTPASKLLNRSGLGGGTAEWIPLRTEHVKYHLPNRRTPTHLAYGEHLKMENIAGYAEQGRITEADAIDGIRALLRSLARRDLVFVERDGRVITMSSESDGTILWQAIWNDDPGSAAPPERSP